MSNDGWVKSYRKFTEWEWYIIPHMFHLFHHILYKANHKEQKWQGIDIKRGQLVTGRKTLSIETGISEQSVRTCLLRLEKTGELTIKSTNKYSIITIINYNSYQLNDDSINQVSNQQSTSNQPATNQQLTTNKKYKNEKNEKKEKKKKTYSDEALQVLAYLNEKKGTNYRNGTEIQKRLNNGGTMAECMIIIDNKMRDPYFIENPKYMNPVTLFRESNYDKYLNETQHPLRGILSDSGIQNVETLKSWGDKYE